MTRRIHLVVEGKLRSLGERRIENAGIGFGEQQPGRIAGGIARDLATRRILGVLGEADSANGGGIEERAIIEMQQEDGRVWRDRIDLVDRRQPLLDELMFGEAADHPHPLGCRRHRHLASQHVHGVGQ